MINNIYISMVRHLTDWMCSMDFSGTTSINVSLFLHGYIILCFCFFIHYFFLFLLKD